MDRRAAVLAVFAAVSGGASPAEKAQGTARPLRIGLVPDFRHDGLVALLSGALAELGRVEGRDYAYIRSGIFYGGDSQRALDAVLEAKPDLIVVQNLGFAVAARARSRTLPVVMWVSGFPVEGGVAESLSRPGGSVTGMTIYAGGEFFGKLVQLVHEARPGARRVGVLMSYVPPFHPRAEADIVLRGMHAVAGPLGVELLVHEVSEAQQVDAALQALARQGAQALVLTSDPSMRPRMKEVFRFAIEHRLPAIIDAPWGELGEPRPLLEYHADFPALLRQVAPYVDKILWQGAKPGDLPIQLPSRFVFRVNRRTARLISLNVPRALLLRADQVND